MKELEDAIRQSEELLEALAFAGVDPNQKSISISPRMLSILTQAASNYFLSFHGCTNVTPLS